MSREILFKAKRANWRELPKEEWWVEGFYYKMNETTYAFADDYEKNPVPTHHYILFERMTDWGLPNQMHQVKVDGKTVCQYTGLDDKDKRKIFEGDILRIKTENLSKKDGCFVVEWSEPGSCFVACGKSYLAHFDNAYEDCREVIGNIFDNPELLKAGQQLETS